MVLYAAELITPGISLRFLILVRLLCFFCFICLFLIGGLVSPGGGFERERVDEGEPEQVPGTSRGPAAHPLRHSARDGEHSSAESTPSEIHVVVLTLLLLLFSVMVFFLL